MFYFCSYDYLFYLQYCHDILFGSRRLRGEGISMFFLKRKSAKSAFPPHLLDRLFNGDQAKSDEVEEAQIVFFDERTEGHCFSSLNQGFNHG